MVEWKRGKKRARRGQRRFRRQKTAAECNASGDLRSKGFFYTQAQKSAARRFPAIPGETEFIPLPDTPRLPRYP